MVITIVFCFLVALASIMSVWTAHPLSDDVFSWQDSTGLYRGIYPWSQFSYPLALTVYHTPLDHLTIDQYEAHGKAMFKIVLAGTSVIQINGNFTYLYYVIGPMPLNYQIDSVFSNSDSFFWSLVALFTVINFATALVGIALAKLLTVAVQRLRSTSTARQAPQPSISILSISSL